MSIITPEEGMYLLTKMLTKVGYDSYRVTLYTQLFYKHDYQTIESIFDSLYKVNKTIPQIAIIKLRRFVSYNNKDVIYNYITLPRKLVFGLGRLDPRSIISCLPREICRLILKFVR